MILTIFHNIFQMRIPINKLFTFFIKLFNSFFRIFSLSNILSFLLNKSCQNQTFHIVQSLLCQAFLLFFLRQVGKIFINTQISLGHSHRGFYNLSFIVIFMNLINILSRIINFQLIKKGIHLLKFRVHKLPLLVFGKRSKTFFYIIKGCRIIFNLFGRRQIIKSVFFIQIFIKSIHTFFKILIALFFRIISIFCLYIIAYSKPLGHFRHMHRHIKHSLFIWIIL